MEDCQQIMWLKALKIWNKLRCSIHDDGRKSMIYKDLRYHFVDLSERVTPAFVSKIMM